MTYFENQNTSYCHFTNSANIPFYFNKAINVDGDIRLYNGNGYLLSTGQMFAKGYHFIGNDNNNYVLLAGGSYKQWTTNNTANALVSRDGSGDTAAEKDLFPTRRGARISEPVRALLLRRT